MFQSLFVDTTISKICNPWCIEIHILFTIFNNKELRNFKGRPTHSILKGMDHG